VSCCGCVLLGLLICCLLLAHLPNPRLWKDARAEAVSRGRHPTFVHNRTDRLSFLELSLCAFGRLILFRAPPPLQAAMQKAGLDEDCLACDDAKTQASGAHRDRDSKLLARSWAAGTSMIAGQGCVGCKALRTLPLTRWPACLETPATQCWAYRHGVVCSVLSAAIAPCLSLVALRLWLQSLLLLLLLQLALTLT